MASQITEAEFYSDEQGNPSQEVTFSVWFKPPSTPGMHAFLTRQGAYGLYCVRELDGGCILLIRSDSDEPITAYLPNNTDLYHAVFTLYGGVADLYLDGEIKNSGPFNVFIFGAYTGAYTYVGASDVFDPGTHTHEITEQYQGEIRRATIFNFAMHESGVSRLYPLGPNHPIQPMLHPEGRKYIDFKGSEISHSNKVVSPFIVFPYTVPEQVTTETPPTGQVTAASGPITEADFYLDATRGTTSQQVTFSVWFKLPSSPRSDKPVVLLNRDGAYGLYYIYQSTHNIYI